MARYDRKRLAVDIPIELHDELKLLAERYNITITTIILRCIIEKLQIEKQYE